MSLPVVLATVETTGAAVSGIKGHSAGLPLPAPPWDQTPWLAVEWDGTWQEAFVTFGVLELRYGVRLTVTLGSSNLHPADALSLAADLKDRLRAAFSADPTLGGQVTQAYLDQGAHNLLTYFAADPTPAPFCEWVLHITEHVAASAASQT